jgi:hypothetical protein
VIRGGLSPRWAAGPEKNILLLLLLLLSSSLPPLLSVDVVRNEFK